MAQILFLTQLLPYPLDAGPKMRAYFVLRHLAQAHQVTLASFVREEDPPDAVSHLETFCAAVHTVPMVRSPWLNARALGIAALTGRPIIIVRDEIAAMQRLIARLVNGSRYDVVHADQTSMAQYGLYAQRVASPTHRPRAVFDVHNALHRVYAQMRADEPSALRRLYIVRERAALERYERRLWPQFDAAVFVTNEDRAALGAPLGDQPGLASIPICAAPEDRALVTPAPDPKLVLHLGTMFWPPNVQGVLWFARQVWPRVVAAVPDARFAIVGRRPPAEVEALAADPTIQITGYVDDPTPYLEQTAAFVVPLHAGAGMRVKIVDAWSWGVPVVSTTLGAEGIAVTHGEDALVADDPAAFADAVVRLLRELALRQGLRDNGRVMATTAYNWQVRYADWDRVYAEVLGE
jgi:glycosyltransferase involved in cell wall biosynthesis